MSGIPTAVFGGAQLEPSPAGGRNDRRRRRRDGESPSTWWSWRAVSQGACIGAFSGSGRGAPSQPLSGAGPSAAAYGAGADQAPVAVFAPPSPPASLRNDMKREHAANQEFRNAITKEQRRMQTRLESFEAPRLGSGGSGGGWKGSVNSEGRLVKQPLSRPLTSPPGDGSGGRAWFSGLSSAACVSTFVTLVLCVAALVAFAATTDFARAGGVAAKEAGTPPLDLTPHLGARHQTLDPM